MRKIFVFVALAAVLLAILAAPAAAQSAGDDESVLVRVNGDVTIPDDEPHGVVVVVNGDLDLEGSATTVVVVNGRADLGEATVETLVVINGTAELGAETRVTGDVRLIESDLSRDPSATVGGSIERGTGDFTRGFWILGFVFMVGWAVMAIVAALVLAAVAPGLARRTGRTITAELGPTLLAGLILWVAAPIVSAALFASFIGIPIALTLGFAVLPAVAFVGFLVAGVRLGEYLTAGGDGVGHPYLAALTGSVILLALGAIPFLGPVVVSVAAFVGSGALALHAYRAVRSEPPVQTPPVPTPPAPVLDG